MGCATSHPEVARNLAQAGPDRAEGGGIKRHFFLAVNGSSGGLAARQLLDMGVPRFEMRLRDDREAEIVIFSLKDADEREARLAELAELAHKPDEYDVRIVACGGDGTVKWVISCLSRFDALNVPIGVIPFGTGNDLARVMGWGDRPPKPLIGTAMAALRERLILIDEAEKAPLDVWLCTINLRDSSRAKFEGVEDKKVVEVSKGEKSVTHEMINYFSMGADGQLMFAFEQNRKSSQLGNKRVYVAKGISQQVWRPPKLKRFIESAHHTDKGDDEDSRTPLLFKHNDRQLLFLNIPSYGAGADPWRRRGDKHPTASAATDALTRQYIGDRKLEVLSVRRTSDVAMSLTMGRTSGLHRLRHGADFELNFREGAEVYFQVDGEALKAVDAKSVEVHFGFQVQMLRAPKAKAVPFPPGFTNPEMKAAALATAAMSSSSSSSSSAPSNEGEVVVTEQDGQDGQESGVAVVTEGGDLDVKVETKADEDLGTENEDHGAGTGSESVALELGEKGSGPSAQSGTRSDERQDLPDAVSRAAKGNDRQPDMPDALQGHDEQVATAPTVEPSSSRSRESTLTDVDEFETQEEIEEEDESLETTPKTSGPAEAAQVELAAADSHRP